MQSPTAVPRIPASASGVSTHRSAPYLSRSPAVARKTPPARPTSSPITITFGSRPSSTWKASLIASTSVSSLTERLPQLGEVARDRVARRLVDGEHVTAVDAHARDSVADRLVGQRLGGRLRGQRRRDRPLVVVAEENDGGAHDGGEVRAFVERALGGGSVAEVGDRARLLAAQLLAPREPGSVRHVRRDRDADRGHVVVGGVPPARRVAAP